MDELIKKAKDAQKNAFAPYSRFKVGSAAETKDGKIFTGCNIENASYGLDICAERMAIFKAVSEGHRDIKRVVFITSGDKFYTPCGACRQVMAEFNPNMEVVSVNGKNKIKRFSLAVLFPKPFVL